MKVLKLVVVSLLLFQTVKSQSLKEAIRFSEREQFQKAKICLMVLLKTEPKNAENYYYLGDTYLKNEQPDSARYWFMQGVSLNENHPLNYVGLGKISMEKNPVEGKANFDKALSMAKKDGRIYASIAEYYMSIEKIDGKTALEYATKGVEVDPKNSWAKLILGDVYIGTSSEGGSKAIEQYKASLALEKNSPVPLWKIGKLYSKVKNYELAIQTFKDGLVQDSLFAPIYKDLAELYYKSRKFEKAIGNYQKYLSIRDKSDATDFRYASFLYLNEDYTNSLLILNDLSKKDFKNPVLYRLIGYSQFETKEYKLAQQNMDIFWKRTEAKKIIPQDYEYYGKILAKNGQDSLAVTYLTTALSKDSTKKELYDEIASIWYSAKKFDKAASAYQKKIDVYKAASKNTILANDYLSMGYSYLLCKNYTLADSAFANLIILKPELPIGYLNRARAKGTIDPNQEQGLAKPYYEKFIELAKVDTGKNKKELIEAYSYLGSYYYKKDKLKFDDAWTNVRALDPTNKAGIEAAKIKW